MATNRFYLFLRICCFLAVLIILGPSPLPGKTSTATSYLARVMDQFHQTYDVYTDSHAAGNHFTFKGKMPNGISDTALPPMKENYPGDSGVGINCIECTFNSSQAPWGGWYFMNGVLSGTQTVPQQNWGNVCEAGVDLTGATQLTFKAKGAKGGEVVEFFCFGVGRDPDTGEPAIDPKTGEPFPCPDSNRKVTLGKVTLSSQWGLYTINLGGLNLSYVLGGFGWVASAADNRNQDIKFYLDDIRFNKARLNEARLLVSYQTILSTDPFDIVMRNVAFTYDNAVALLAFLAQGKKEEARLLADALVYAYQNDRYYRNQDLTQPDSRRLRNAYQGGDLVLWPGWTPHGNANTVRMPGFPLPMFYPDIGTWSEDEFQVSTHTGNLAWAMIALLGFYEKGGSALHDGKKYLDTAINLGEWIENNCRGYLGPDDPGGYTGGYEGWEPNPKKLTYKATEHNIDLYVAFKRLFLITRDNKWLERANHAKNFVANMWDKIGQDHFWTGTDPDGITTNDKLEQIPLDIQAWANLAFVGEEGRPYRIALDYCESHHRFGAGYDFNWYPQPDGIWYEGTAHMALAYQATGQKDKWQNLLNSLHQAQASDGGLPAASIDGLTTGFLLPDNKSPWLYYHRSHVGATAWLILAEQGFNPFWPPKGVVPLDLLLLQ